MEGKETKTGKEREKDPSRNSQVLNYKELRKTINEKQKKRIWVHVITSTTICKRMYKWQVVSHSTGLRSIVSSISSMEEMMVYMQNLESHSLNQGCEVVPSAESAVP